MDFPFYFSTDKIIPALATTNVAANLAVFCLFLYITHSYIFFIFGECVNGEKNHTHAHFPESCPSPTEINFQNPP